MMLADLLPLLHADRLGPGEWEAMIRAFTSFGGYGRTLLEEHLRRHPIIERVRWMIEELERYRTDALWLEVADRAFLQGRIEPAVEGAFAAEAVRRASAEAPS